MIEKISELGRIKSKLKTKTFSHSCKKDEKT